MAGFLVPVIIGGRVIQMAAPRAMELIRAGVAKALPRMRDIGGQRAGANPSGPFYGGMRSNAPPAGSRPWSPAVSTAVAAGGLGVLADGGGGDPDAGGGAGSQGGPPPLPIRRAPPPNRYRPMEPDWAGIANDITDNAAALERAMPSPVSAEGLSDDALGGWPIASPAPAAAPRDAPLPPPRPREDAPAMRGDYQSMNALADGPDRYMPARVMQGDRVNFGDNDSAADFFRADRALMSMGRASGGRADLMQMAREALSMQMSRRHSEEALKAMLRPQPAQRAEGGRAEGRGSGNDKVLEHAMAILRHLITGGSR
jgi:hypothetical protein